MRRRRRTGSRSRTHRAGARRRQGRGRAGRGVREAAAGPREGDDCPLQIPEVGEVRERAAEDADRKSPALQIEGMILHPKNWKRPSGYSNGVAAEGRQVFVAGQVGWNAQQEIVSDDFVAQAEQALRNIVEILAEADARPEHLVRLTWYVTDTREYRARSTELGQAYQRAVGRHFPAMTLVQVAALVDDRAKVEIEATAVVRTSEVSDLQVGTNGPEIGK